MSDKETAETFQLGIEMLMQNSRMIAMLPLEDWDRAFSKFLLLGFIMRQNIARSHQDDECLNSPIQTFFADADAENNFSYLTQPEGQDGLFPAIT